MSVDWGALFRLDAGVLELAIRTSVVYLALIFGFRALGRRRMGALQMTDLLLIVLIADGVQSGMAGEYTSLTGAIVVGGTLIGCNWVLDYLSYRFKVVQRLLEPAELKLVEHGRIVRRNLHREYITEDELRSQLRAQGVEDLSEVKEACLEPDGELSVMKYQDGEERPNPHAARLRRVQ